MTDMMNERVNRRTIITPQFTVSQTINITSIIATSTSSPCLDNYMLSVYLTLIVNDHSTVLIVIVIFTLCLVVA